MSLIQRASTFPHNALYVVTLYCTFYHSFHNMTRHNKLSAVVVWSEPRRSWGLLWELAIDSRGLENRTCPRIDPIVRAIAHSCARDRGPTYSTLPTLIVCN